MKQFMSFFVISITAIMVLLLIWFLLEKFSEFQKNAINNRCNENKIIFVNVTLKYFHSTQEITPNHPDFSYLFAELETIAKAKIIRITKIPKSIALDYSDRIIACFVDSDVAHQRITLSATPLPKDPQEAGDDVIRITKNFKGTAMKVPYQNYIKLVSRIKNAIGDK